MKEIFRIIVVSYMIFATAPAWAGCYFPNGIVRAVGSAPLVFGTLDAWRAAKKDAFIEAAELCGNSSASLVYDGDSYWELSSKSISGGQIGYARNIFGCGPKMCIWPY